MDELTTQSTANQLVPAGFAEKAMASLMQLHGELMDEKERRVELFRRLMEKEQALAELKMYVKLLEEKVTPAPMPVAVAVDTPGTPPPPTPPRINRVMPPVPPRIATRPQPTGWKTW